MTSLRGKERNNLFNNLIKRNQSAAFSSGKVRPNHETNINIIARRTGKDVNSHTVLDGIITTIMATIQRINIIGSREGSRICQAENGIRDYKVTGVQTCALPIWPRHCSGPSTADIRISSSGARVHSARRSRSHAHARPDPKARKAVVTPCASTLRHDRRVADRKSVV